MKRKFEGIWIPREVWLSEALTLQEKIFLVEINSLDNDKGCYANNEYFARFFGISKTRVSVVINSLVEKGLLISHINAQEGNKRTLKTLLNFSLRPSYSNVKDPLKLSFKDNNTVNNTENNTLTKGCPLFEIFWDSYGKKLERETCEKKWAKLSHTDKELILQHVPAYVRATPELQYRKHPKTYLNNKCWFDELPTLTVASKPSNMSLDDYKGLYQ